MIFVRTCVAVGVAGFALRPEFDALMDPEVEEQEVEGA